MCLQAHFVGRQALRSLSYISGKHWDSRVSTSLSFFVAAVLFLIVNYSTTFNLFEVSKKTLVFSSNILSFNFVLKEGKLICSLDTCIKPGMFLHFSE